ncbi:hypothetical protein KC322_g105 [Hortaea werneckii]|nr:hypothetical protein KC322_g105 [Hortaea werneckii]
MSRHFLLLLVKRVETRPIGHGSIFARSRPAQSVSQTISSQIINHSRRTPPTTARVNTNAPKSNGISNITTSGAILLVHRRCTPFLSPPPSLLVVIESLVLFARLRRRQHSMGRGIMIGFRLHRHVASCPSTTGWVHILIVVFIAGLADDSAFFI